MTMQKQQIQLFSETLPLAFSDQGEGRTYLILHGGAGTASVAGLATALATDARVIVPTHPGFDGERRPDWFRRIDDLAIAYLALLERLALSNVIVIGNSVGGWIAAEMALRQSPRIAGIVLLNAVGIDTGSPDRRIVDPTAITPAERRVLAFHDPDRFAFAPSGPDAIAALTDNQRTLFVYAGEPFMHDPTLRSRLAQISIPALVAWGESDGIVDTEYGRLFAQSIPGARFELVREAGHFPHIERLDEVVRLVGDLAPSS